jgi:hypothetical protein
MLHPLSRCGYLIRGLGTLGQRAEAIPYAWRTASMGRSAVAGS